MGCFFCFISGVCAPHFIRLWGRFEEKTCTQTWTWETQLKYSTLFHFLQTQEEEIRAGVLNVYHTDRCTVLYKGCII